MEEFGNISKKKSKSQRRRERKKLEKQRQQHILESHVQTNTSFKQKNDILPLMSIPPPLWLSNTNVSNNGVLGANPSAPRSIIENSTPINPKMNIVPLGMEPWNSLLQTSLFVPMIIFPNQTVYNINNNNNNNNNNSNNNNNNNNSNNNNLNNNNSNNNSNNNNCNNNNKSNNNNNNHHHHHMNALGIKKTNVIKKAKNTKSENQRLRSRKRAMEYYKRLNAEKAAKAEKEEKENSLVVPKELNISHIVEKNNSEIFDYFAKKEEPQKKILSPIIINPLWKPIQPWSVERDKDYKPIFHRLGFNPIANIRHKGVQTRIRNNV
ncbi:ras-related protein RabX-like [Leptopilina boulardi]|uniref:ras-related protein RabX-like n=1 Tax=Leptopilina boulardi TaxID=63433 RepID=UPI0021F65C55|nr:ras-related protein RabX-like [Leptopilina boulardi]